ncbi:MAG TPA: hypothetical protein VMM13_19040 [Euzebya sp.]|nr:hypothetical protein [Euzebya sp.]
MHDPHPTNGPAAPQTAHVAGFDAARATLPDGRAVLVLSYDPTGPHGLACDAHGLRDALAAAPADVVVFRPRGADLEALLDAASACDRAHPVMATAAPVTDAVKRISGPLVVATVARTRLAWAVGPGVVDAATLQAHLPSVAGATVWPLTAAGGRVTWL